MSSRVDPFSRLVVGTAALGALAIIFAMIELRRENASWGVRNLATLPASSSSIAPSESGRVGVSSAAPAPARPPKATPDQPALRPVVSTALPTERSPLADKLHDANQTGMEDLKVVMNLFAHYRERFGGFPTGEDNASIVNALTGNNPSQMAFIERDHRAIDAQGQLLDRWGTPLFFHLIASDALEIRSAGPDNSLYTADDLVTASLRAKHALADADPYDD
jgi:hypothetical protein